MTDRGVQTSRGTAHGPLSDLNYVFPKLKDELSLVN